MTIREKIRKIAVWGCCFILFSCTETKEVIEYVNPFIGTEQVGHTYPGATVPFGMVQLSPDTRTEDWSACSGYQYTDTLLYGFSHTHMSGTGGADLGDILFLPLTGNFDATWLKEKKQMRMLKDGETATAGYYSVKLGNGVLSELTATPHCGVHRYTYPAGERSLLVDLTHYLKKEHIHQLELKQISDTEIQGMRFSSGWVSNQYIYFIARFSAPIRKINGWCDGKLTYEKDLKGTDIRAILEFENGNAPVEVSVGISATGYEGARKNIEAEMPSPKFDKALMQAVASWDTEMGRIDISGATDDEKTIFYTALYHTMICPNLFSDVDYKYRGMDGKLHEGKSPHYATFSLWDTYRAVHPLYTVLYPDFNADMMRSLVEKGEQNGYLPKWELWGGETDCMIGFHAISVLGEAIVKDLGGFDYEKAYQLCKKTYEAGRDQFPSYEKYGYVPSNETGRKSVSKTVEYAYNDWCLAQIAKRLGHQEDYEFYLKRSENYRNLFDGETGFFRGRSNTGIFDPDFQGNYMDNNFTEATPWQYRHYVPHDIKGLSNLLGGRDSLAKSLDALFEADTAILGKRLPDVTGRLGQYAHGNEPSHGTAFLYAYSSEPWKTSALTKKILACFYQNTPSGLCGNDDCGQMSAWYVFTSIGMYPMCPGSDEFILTAPEFDKTVINLANGKKFTIKVKGDREDVYIDKITLNGKEIDRNYIKYHEIMDGGELVFTLTDKPNMKRGLKEESLPYSMTTENKAPMPYTTSDIQYFPNERSVILKVRHPHAKIYYTLDGSEPDDRSTLYTQPIKLHASATIKAVAYVEGKTKSDVMVAEAIKADYLPGKKVNPTRKGVSYAYYEGKMKSTADMLKMQPLRTGVCSGFSFGELNPANDHFGVIFKAYIKLTQKDVYEFILLSDDGSVLFIDGQPVALNDGSHSTAMGNGKIALDAGFHEIEVRYMEDTDWQELRVGMIGGGHNSWGALSSIAYVK